MIQGKFRGPIAAAIVSVLALSACATKDDVAKAIQPVADATKANADQIGKTQTDLASTKGTVQAQGAQVSAISGQVGALNGQLGTLAGQVNQVDTTSKQALDRATAAGVLAEGKFNYTVTLSDDGVKFPADSSKLSPEAQTRLNELAAKLKTDNKNVYLEIQGYTDSLGSAAGNNKLGADRAEAVRRYLSQQGVPLSRMSTISYGSDNPAASNKTKDGRAQNRRVVVVVLS